MRHTTAGVEHPSEFDVVIDADPFSDADVEVPEPIDATVRETAPFVFFPEYDIWATGRHELAATLFKDYERFSSAAGTGVRNLNREGNWRKRSGLLDADPPQHTPLRKVMNRVLGLANIRKLKEGFERRADELAAEVVARGEFDAAADFARPFPLEVLPDAIGLRDDDRERLMLYSEINFNAMGPWNHRYEAAVEAAGQETIDYVAEIIERDQLDPNGLGEQFYQAADAGEITHEQAKLLVRAFPTAGVDTTIYGIGLSLHALAERPEQWAILHGNPSLARAAFEEGLRFTPSSPKIGRTTKGVVEIADYVFPDDTKIINFLGAAGRDPRRWERPDEFDITRDMAGHVSFGVGIHACVGQMTARMEAEALIGALARRVKSIELAGEPVRARNNWLRGFESLPVRVVPA